MRKLPLPVASLLLLLGLAAWAGTPVNLKSAIDHQRALAADRPTDAAAQNDLGNLLVLDGDLGGAEQAYRRAIELDPQRLTAQFNLGLLQQQRGENRAAMQSFRRVLEIDARHAWAHYQIGMIYQGGGVDDAAVRSYARAFALDPRLAQASFNPQLIDNPLATRAVLLAFREHASEVQAPPRFEERDRIARLLVAEKEKEAPGASANPAGEPQVVTVQPSAAPATAAPASGARTLGVQDLATGKATGQVRSGASAPGRAPTTSRPSRYPTYVAPPEPQESYEEGDEMEPVEPPVEPPPGPGFMPPSAVAPGVYQPGFRPVPQSSGRLELHLRPLDDTGRG